MGGGGGSSNPNSSSIWSYIIRVGLDFAKLGINFNQSFVREIGNGRDTLFWDDLWFGDQRFKDKFPRLYQLESSKAICVSDRIHKDASGLTFTWQWSRMPNGRTLNDVGQLQTSLDSMRFHSGDNDRWVWQLDNNEIFKSYTMASLLDEKLLHNSYQGQETVRNKLLPKKIEIFAWRALKKRIPTRVELDKKCIDLDSVRCPVCDDDLETAEHALVFCRFAMEVWARVFQWWNLGNVSTLSIAEIFKDERPYSSSHGNGII
ncbi:uncharacterized protein [Rutidosis leptorrhynchoides]|uniref:uncharacterized protein n=1 Tax=Rutidosis leptorrhynchoides TaxID=125765 RepID=UPI003A991503